MPQCELLRINHSMINATPARPNEKKRLLRESMMAQQDYWHTMFPAMGARKLAVKLQEDGFPAGAA